MFRLAQRAEDDLDDIWLYIARSSGNMDVATSFIEAIHSRFLLLARFPRLGRPRDREFGTGRRSYSVHDYIIVYFLDGDVVDILRVVHGSRDLEGLYLSG